MIVNIPCSRLLHDSRQIGNFKVVQVSIALSLLVICQGRLRFPAVEAPLINAYILVTKNRFIVYMLNYFHGNIHQICS